MQSSDRLNGALIIDKPCGLTSHDVVARIRRQFNLQKVGHCGTLDPNVTGILVILVGRATKMSDRLMGEDKAYEGTAKFGETTDSYDGDGQIMSTFPVPLLTLEMLNETAETFYGDSLQSPPMVSAVKIDGVPLYKLARKGIEVERKPRLVHIYRFRFSEYVEPNAKFEVICTKGTYVRSLIHDLGQTIGCGAYMSSLRRTVSGPYNIKQSVPFDTLMAQPISELEKHLIPVLEL